MRPPSPAPYETARGTFQAESQAEAEASRISSEDDIGHVIVAIDMKDHGTVGCAYYSAEQERMYFLGDSRSGEFETIEACVFDVCFQCLLL